MMDLHNFMFYLFIYFKTWRINPGQEAQLVGVLSHAPKELWV